MSNPWYVIGLGTEVDYHQRDFSEGDPFPGSGMSPEDVVAILNSVANEHGSRCLYLNLEFKEDFHLDDEGKADVLLSPGINVVVSRSVHLEGATPTFAGEPSKKAEIIIPDGVAHSAFKIREARG